MEKSSTQLFRSNQLELSGIIANTVKEVLGGFRAASAARERTKEFSSFLADLFCTTIVASPKK